ncbi:DUF2207 domain-containing protein [Kineococcus sp. SYSU DK018]|uniref:DUF2207 domain-containing protein n=1 Tax=Kineococcus sp. SYSU DK018 TaxID=3383139 RepID=UPI003D7E2DD5
MSPGLVHRAGAAASLAAAVLAGPAAVAAAAGEPGEDERVRSYAVDLDVQADGGLAVRETIVYDFGDEGHHGLLRSIPVRAPHDSTHDRRHPVSDLRVSSPSGAPAQVEVEEDGGRLDVRVGDPDSEDVRGEETYVLEYRLGAVVDGTGAGGVEGQRLRVDVLGAGWQVPVERVEATLTAPGPLAPLECVTGEEGSRTPCAVQPGAVPGTASFSASDLRAGQGVTVGAVLPAGTVAATGPLLVDTFSPRRAFTADAATLPAVGAVLAAGAGAVLLARRRARAAGATPSAAPSAGSPPQGPPGVLGALVHGGATGDDVVATLLDLAQRGHLVLAAEGGREEGGRVADWRLERRGSADPTSPAEDRLLHTLFRGSPVTTLSALRTRSRAGVQLTRQLLDDEAVHRGWFRDRPSRLAHRRLGRALAGLALAAAAAVALVLWTRFGLAGLALVAVVLVVPFAARPRSPLTAEGHRVRARFEAYAAGLDRSAGDPGWAPAGGALARHLPHAVALGATDRWAAAAAALQASPEPVSRPGWYAGGTAGFNPVVFGALVGTFSADASGSLTAPPAAGASSASSSSSSPSGGFVGGGAGGGGGGSW